MFHEKRTSRKRNASVSSGLKQLKHWKPSILLGQEHAKRTEISGPLLLGEEYVVSLILYLGVAGFGLFKNKARISKNEARGSLVRSNNIAKLKPTQQK